MEKKWHILQPDAAMAKKLSAGLHCHPITAAVLINRNLTSARRLQIFWPHLAPGSFSLCTQDMDAAVNRIYRAIAEMRKF